MSHPSEGDLAHNEPSVRLNFTLTGKPAELILKWKNDGMITSYSDAIVQAIFSLDAKFLRHEMARLRIEAIREEDSSGEHL
jgi:hypothetical protein